jgi:threonylcarbamoyladenosine tRNA methylthiotransferase MtaB
MPHACIGVDVIVGFPGETEEEFKATYDFINSLDISYLHVFTYSERANTRALNISPVVPKAIRKERNEMLRILSEKKKHAFYEQHLNTERKVLWESPSDEGEIFGFTDNYIKVGVSRDTSLTNTVQILKLSDIAKSGYMKVQYEGEMVEVAL